MDTQAESNTETPKSEMAGSYTLRVPQGGKDREPETQGAMRALTPVKKDLNKRTTPCL